MCRDVARAVRYGCRLAALAETGERAERRAGVRGVRVVDGDRNSPVDGGDGGRPGRVPGEADLGAQPLLGRLRPPPGEPLGLSADCRLPEPLGPVLPYEHEPRYADGVHLGDLHGYVVQPLVGEQQSGDPLRGSLSHSTRGSSPSGRSAISTPYARTRAATSAGSAASTPTASSPRPAARSTKSSAAGRSRASSTRHRRRATAPAKSADAWTDVRKCPAGPSGLR